MKKLRITVNNAVYDVVVEVLEDDEQNVPGANFLSPLPTPTAASRLPQPSSAAPRPAPLVMPRPGGPGDPNVIAAPIAGIVQKIFVAAGARVEAKAPVVMLDAMKMDTYIYAPRGGTVADVAVEVGGSVQVGDVLMRYKPEE
jgi:biotin carboxyl carrier protein